MNINLIGDFTMKQQGPFYALLVLIGATLKEQLAVS